MLIQSLSSFPAKELQLWYLVRLFYTLSAKCLAIFYVIWTNRYVLPKKSTHSVHHLYPSFMAKFQSHSNRCKCKIKSLKEVLKEVSFLSFKFIIEGQPDLKRFPKMRDII